MTTVSAETLRTLHRLHEQLAELRGQLDRAPKQIAVRRAAVTALNNDRNAAHEAVASARKAADGKQLDVKSQEQKLEKWRGQLNAASSNQEYNTLKEQIAATEMAASVLEDETLELLERIDELTAEAGRADEHLAKGEDDYAAFEKQLKERLASCQADIARLEADLKETEKQLSGDFVADYHRLVRGKGPDAMAPMEGGCCLGCGQSITANMQSDLMLNKPTLCKSCGVLLYLPE